MWSLLGHWARSYQNTFVRKYVRYYLQQCEILKKKDQQHGSRKILDRRRYKKALTLLPVREMVVLIDPASKDEYIKTEHFLRQKRMGLGAS